MKHLTLLLLIAVSPAWAAKPEICGDGIDDACETGGSCSTHGSYGSCNTGYHNSTLGTGHGCDADCDEPDKDNDGYSSDGTRGSAGGSGIDCDDTNSRIYPGVYTESGCSSGQVRLCNSDGTYSSCVTNSSINQSTNGGGRIYVDCGNSLGSASDVNAGTSYSAPKLTVSACVGAITAGGVCYVIGTGTCNAVTTLTGSGTAADPKRLYRIPGSTAKLDSTGSTLNLTSVSGWAFDNLDINGTSAAIDDNNTGANDVTMSRLFVHDIAGDGNTNQGCLRFQHGSRVDLNHSIAKDCVWASGNIENISALMWLCESGECADMSAKWNTFVWSNFDPAINGSGIYGKHGNLATSAGANGQQIKYNSFINCGNTGGGACIYIGGSKYRIMGNRFYTDDNYTNIKIGDRGGSTANQDNWVQYNTFISGLALSWTPLWYSSGTQPRESLRIDHNVVISTTANYGSDITGIYSICGRSGSGLCDSTRKAIFETNGYLSSDKNCYYSPNATAQFSYFKEGGGSNYSYSGWQGTVSQDVNSPALGDPGISTPKWAATGSCATFGWNHAPLPVLSWEPIQMIFDLNNH